MNGGRSNLVLDRAEAFALRIVKLYQYLQTTKRETVMSKQVLRSGTITMKLTVVTATFNAIKSGNRENLIRCVRSVAALKTEHEHLIYDGASTDGTVELLRELEKEINNSTTSHSSLLTIHSEKDTGIYNALNKGVRDAQGEWFYVLGCDDYIIAPNTFDELLEQVDAGIDIVVAPTVRDGHDPLYKKIPELRTLFRQFPYSHQSVIMRLEVVREVGGFDERYRLCADWAMLMACYKLGKKFWYTEKPITYYAEGGLSESVSCARTEQISVYSEFWGLRDWRKRLFAATGYIPLLRILALFKSDDFVIRNAAHYAIRLWLKAVFRIALWPAVVIRRRILFGGSNAC